MIVRLYRYKRNFKTDSSDGWTRFIEGRSFIKTKSTSSIFEGIDEPSNLLKRKRKSK